MKVTQKTYQRFNTKDTLIVLSSFPLQQEEIARRNAVSRYTYLLLKEFSQHKKCVVICETVADQNNQPYLLQPNILVLPTFQVNTWSMFAAIQQAVQQFPLIKKVLVQFEFSLFGKEVIAFSLSIFLGWLRLQGKQVYTLLHQVVVDLTTLSEQVNLTKGSLKAGLINQAMKCFYALMGLANNKILVHDSFLADKLQSLVPQSKVGIIPHGIAKFKAHSARKKTEWRYELGIKKNQKVLLVYGYHSWYKGTDFVLGAFEKFVQRQPGTYKLILAGDVAPTQKHQPHLRKYYQNLQTRIQQAGSSVIHTGFVPEKQVAKLFSVADLVIFPYRSRMSSSGALSVALQHRKPFICSTAFAENLRTADFTTLLQALNLPESDFAFSLNQASFDLVLKKFFTQPETTQKMIRMAKELTQARLWPKVAETYIEQMNEEVPEKELTYGSVPALLYETS